MRTSHYCGDFTALTTTKWGAKIYVDTRDTSLAPHIMVEGDWEPWVTNCIVMYLQKHKGCTFIDVGANVGWYTLLACGLGASKVFAFEPNPRMAALLRKTIAVNGLKETVCFCEAACGETYQKATLQFEFEEIGGGHVVGAAPAASPGFYDGLMSATGVKKWATPETICNVLPLDDYVRTRSPDAKVIVKIDVEGYEPQVLAGAQELLAEHPILFIEHHHRDEAHTKMLQDLQDRGYELRHVQHSGHQSPPLSVASAAALGDAETILCTYPER